MFYKSQSYDHLEDEGLMELVQQGHRSAFAALLSRHVDRCYRVAFRIVLHKDDAEEIVQQCFLKLWERPQSWDKKVQIRFSSWFYRVVVNQGLDCKKKKRPDSLPEILHVPSGDVGPAVVLEEKVMRERLGLGLAKLPERQRAALTLSFYEGFSNKEAAETLGLNLKAFESLLVRAKQTLKDKLKGG